MINQPVPCPFWCDGGPHVPDVDTVANEVTIRHEKLWPTGPAVVALAKMLRDGETQLVECGLLATDLSTVTGQLVSPVTARRLATDLLEAADLVDRLIN